MTQVGDRLLATIGVYTEVPPSEKLKLAHREALRDFLVAVHGYDFSGV